MAEFFNIIVHILIICGTLAMFGFIILMISTERRDLEKVIKTAALVTGFLIYCGAKAVGISIPSMIMASVQTTNPMSFSFFSVIIPFSTGTLVAWYCTNCIKSSQTIAERIVIIMTTFITVMFGDVYASTYSVHTVNASGIDTALLPNLTFTLGITLYVIFKYEEK